MSESYARLYYKFQREFPEVYADDHLLSGWVRLLMLADASWPMRPPIPRSIRSRILADLVARGLVIPDGDAYTVLGLDAERTRRSSAGRTGAAVRWQSERNAIASAVVMPSKAEQSKDEQSSDGRSDLEAFLAVRFRAPTPNQRTFMDAYCRTFDVTGPDRAARLIFANPDDPIGAMKSDLEAWRGERRDAARAAEAPKPPVRRKASSLTGVNAELAAMFRDQEAKA